MRDELSQFDFKILQFAAINNDPSAALPILKDMLASKRVVVDEDAYSRCLAACKREQRSKDTLETLALMRKNGDTPLLKHYTIAVFSMRDNAELRAMYEEVIESKLPLDEYFLNAVLARASDWRWTLKLYNGMENNGMTPDAYTYSAMISSLTRVGQYSRALALFSSLPEKGIQQTYRMYSSLLATCRRPDLALKLFNEATRDLTDIDQRSHIVLFNSMLSGCANFNSSDMALKLYAGMRAAKDAESRADVHNNTATNTREGILSPSSSSPSYYHADLVYPPPDAISYTHMIAACARGKEWDKADELMRTVLRERLIKEPVQLVKVYTATIHAMAKAGEWERALGYLNRMKRQQLYPTSWTYSAVLHACAKGNQWRRAMDILAQMEGIKNVKPTEYHYSSVLSACRAAIYNEMREYLDTACDANNLEHNNDSMNNKSNNNSNNNDHTGSNSRIDSSSHYGHSGHSDYSDDDNDSNKLGSVSVANQYVFADFTHLEKKTVPERVGNLPLVAMMQTLDDMRRKGLLSWVCVGIAIDGLIAKNHTQEAESLYREALERGMIGPFDNVFEPEKVLDIASGSSVRFFLKDTFVNMYQEYEDRRFKLIADMAMDDETVIQANSSGNNGRDNGDSDPQNQTEDLFAFIPEEGLTIKLREIGFWPLQNFESRANEFMLTATEPLLRLKKHQWKGQSADLLDADFGVSKQELVEWMEQGGQLLGQE